MFSKLGSLGGGARYMMGDASMVDFNRAVQILNSWGTSVSEINHAKAIAAKYPPVAAQFNLPSYIYDFDARTSIPGLQAALGQLNVIVAASNPSASGPVDSDGITSILAAASSAYSADQVATAVEQTVLRGAPAGQTPPNQDGDTHPAARVSQDNTAVYVAGGIAVFAILAALLS